MDKKQYLEKLEKYLTDISEAMVKCDQVEAWAFGALSFSLEIGAISKEDYKRLLQEHTERFETR